MIKWLLPATFLHATVRTACSNATICSRDFSAVMREVPAWDESSWKVLPPTCGWEEMLSSVAGRI
jgi:hypothetical protein